MRQEGGVSISVPMNAFVRPHPSQAAGRSLAEGDAVRFTIRDWHAGETTLEGVVTHAAADLVGVRVEAGLSAAVYLVPADMLTKEAGA